MMDMPSWEAEKIDGKRVGGKKRAALWLVQVVGIGNTFDKAALRAVIPDASQIDRRLRELRDSGWVIHTSRDDNGLSASEQRFVAQGEPVWEPGRATPRSSEAVTATQRGEVMSRDGRICRSCGIGAGEEYEGTHTLSKLDVARRKVAQPDGSERLELVVECNRCRIGGKGQGADLGAVMAGIGRLSPFERKTLAAWVTKDAREFSKLEALWAVYRTLPADSRDYVRGALA